MKNEKGITLASLVIYVIAMVIVLSVLSTIITKFYQNTDSIKADTREILEFNNFNTYFLKEIKNKENKVDTINSNYILFTSGNAFSLSNSIIYYNNISVCNGVQSFDVSIGEKENIINVTIGFENFSKTIKYKIEEIY